MHACAHAEGRRPAGVRSVLASLVAKLAMMAAMTLLLLSPWAAEQRFIRHACYGGSLADGQASAHLVHALRAPSVGLAT